MLAIQNSDILQIGDSILRIVSVENGRAFAIDCFRKQVGKWYKLSSFDTAKKINEQELFAKLGYEYLDEAGLSPTTSQIANQRYAVIASVIPAVTDFRKRCEAVNQAAILHNVSRQTVINYLHDYLVLQSKVALAPRKQHVLRLSEDEKNMRAALNKYYYSTLKNSLRTAYVLMLKDSYTDESGSLRDDYPTFNQFHYYYYSHKDGRKSSISRNGIKYYQRNTRPLLSDGIREYANAVGYGMFDSTICDIFLVDESGESIGRPKLTACVDAYSGLCMGYNLSKTSNTTNLADLLQNIITDKVGLCKQHGIVIDKDQWDCHSLAGVFICDQGKEYTSKTFSQITELGVKVITLPVYRPDLKGVVERFFKTIQDLYKPYLKRKGVIEPDFQERGARDYRKDACLTVSQFEKILLYCIVYYNSCRIVENLPSDANITENGAKPTSASLWNHGKRQSGAHLINVDSQKLRLTMLPRTNGRFSRKGLMVNGMRYEVIGKGNCVADYLSGKSCVVAYNPDNSSEVYLFEDGTYTSCRLIEARYQNKPVDEIENIKQSGKAVIENAERDNLQSRIDLAKHIITIAEQSKVKA